MGEPAFGFGEGFERCLARRRKPALCGMFFVGTREGILRQRPAGRKRKPRQRFFCRRGRPARPVGQNVICLAAGGVIAQAACFAPPKRCPRNTGGPNDEVKFFCRAVITSFLPFSVFVAGRLEVARESKAVSRKFHTPRLAKKNRRSPENFLPKPNYQLRWRFFAHHGRRMGNCLPSCPLFCHFFALETWRA